MADNKTVNFKLPLPDFNKITWHDEYYEGQAILDATLAKYIILNQAQGVWQNATAYSVDDTVVDDVDGQLYQCAVANTSAASPITFSADRTANSTYWVNVTLQERFRGAWATATAYLVGDFVANGNQYAICVENHTSGTFATDVTAVKWVVLIDATASVDAAAASATAAAASAAGVNLPSIVSGDSGNALQVNVGETGYELVKNNIAATTAPVVGDDDADGYAIGSKWFDTTNDVSYVCLDASTGAAVWESTSVQAASTTVAGISEYATVTETNTGTSTTRSITPDGLAGSNFGIVSLSFTSDGELPTATGDGFFSEMEIPSYLNGYELFGWLGTLETAGTTNTLDIQVRNVTQAVDIFSTKITIDSTEKTTATATLAVINAANKNLATLDRLRVDVDAVHTTVGKGLNLTLFARKP